MHHAHARADKGASSQIHARLCELSGWNESETHALRKHFEETPEMSGRDGGAVGMRGSSGLASMQRCFDLAAKVGVDIELLIKLCGLHAEQDTEAAFASYSATAQRLLWALKSKYSHDDWEKTFGPIRDYLNERERDALAALLLQDLRQKAELGPAWQNIRAGEITNFVLLPGSETVFVGTWGSGVFRLQTRGSDTEWLNDGLGSSARDKSIRSLVRASTRKGQTLFAAPSDKGIFRLDENGAQHGWQPCSDGLSGRDFNARQSDSNSDVWALVATADGGILFAGASQGRILRRAADAATGSPWQPLFHNAYAANAIADGKADRFTALQLTSDDKTLLAATAGHGVFRCDIGDESGTGWVPVGSEKPHVYPHCLAVAPDGSLFAGTYESGVFARKLGDGADVKWQELNIGLPSGSVRCLTVTGDGKTVLVATKGGGVFRRDVGAAPDTRWLPLDVGFLYGDVTALAVTSDSRTLFGGTEVGEVFRCNFVDGEWQRPGPRFDTLQDLSEYLLIDVEMSGCAKTSCVNEAIGCVQTYIERCRMHLEDVPIKAPNELNSQWGWMGHYRMWEANRKVFFYPENYLEPSQRKQATPLFKQLQDELLQGDITDEALTDAYINYFDRLDELASLEIIEGHVARVTNPLTDISEETLFIIGRTHSDPPIFFYRSAVYDRAQRRFSGWVAWQKIDLSIPARSVTALYALNRLYLFWAEVKTTTEHLEGERAKRVTTEATVMYTYQRVSGRWVHPQKYPVTAEQGAKLQISGVPTNSSGYLPPVCSLPVPHGRATASLLVRGDLTVKLAQSLKEFSDWSAKSGAPRDPDLSMYMDDWHPLEYLHAVQTVVTPDGHTLFAVSPSACVFRCAVARLANASWDVLTSTTNLPNASTIDITTIAISRSGRTLYAGTTTGGIFVRQVGDASDKPWDQRGPTPSITHVRTDVEMDIFSTTTRTWAWHSSSGVTCLALAPNGQTLFASTLEGGIFTAQVGSGSGANWLQITNVEGRHGAVTSMVVSPDGKFLVVGSAGGGVLRRSLDAALDAPWESLDTLANCSIDALAIAPDGATIYGISRKATSPVSWKDVQAFCISRITEANHNATFLYPSTTLAVAPDSQTVLLGTESFGLLIEKLVDRDDTRWDFQHRVVLPEPIRTLAVTPDGRTVFAGTTKGNIFRCNIGNRELSPDGRTFFASPGTDKTVFGVPSDAGGTMLVVRPGDDGGWVRQPLTTTAIHELRGKLVDGGLKSLLTLASQASVNFDGSDPYSIYFREIFFHIPFLIADALNGNQQFEHARKWYHYILDPTHEKSRRPGDDGGMWRCLFLRDHTMAKLLEELNDAAHHDELAEDPFDPHAIAQTRLGAYEKAVAMKYLDNLLDWGDVLFAQDSWEAINHAVLLYINALNLLGPRPAPASVSLPPTGPARTMTGGRSQLAIHRSTLAHEDLPQTEHSSYREPFDEVPEFLCLPENDEFARYWDRAQDCLFKVRHCMNRQGIVRQLALFEPPLDPRQLIRAMAAGQDIDSLGAQSMPTVPHYRFPVMLQQAKNLTATAMQLGSALLSALEKRDAEDLNLLRSAQEQQVLKMIREIKEQQIEDGARHLESLGHSLGAAQVRADHFSGLIATGYSDAETTSLALDTTAGALHVVAAELNGLSVVGHLVPTIYGAADGGMQPGHAVAAGAQLAGSAAAALQTAAGMAATIAQFQRRAQEWGLQQALAGCDVQQIQAEIAAAESRQTILQRDLETHDVSTEHARERDDFIRRKFGNSDLYQWMSGRLATVCFQTYKLAFDLARSAEKAYQYERHTDQTFLDFGYWDSLRKGLLAGEGLMLGLNQLEKAHLDGDARELEVEKTISLLQLAPMALLDLKAKGECTFDLTEQLFDYDFPGHYCRRIKSVSISIPAVVGPYQNIQATLTQVSDRMLIEAYADAVKSLLPGGKLDPSKPNGVRSSWRPFQQIAISRGVDDSGLFQLDFRDERYLPFEGTGAISSWKLSLPKAANRNLDFASISDVIVHLRYTALDGGERFRDAVIEEIKAFAGVRMFSMRQEFSVAWQNRMNGKMNVRLVDEMFPMNFKAGTLKLGEITSLEVSKDTSPQRAAKQREGQLNGDFAIDGISPAIEDMLLVVPFSAELDYG